TTPIGREGKVASDKAEIPAPHLATCRCLPNRYGMIGRGRREATAVKADNQGVDALFSGANRANRADPSHDVTDPYGALLIRAQKILLVGGKVEVAELLLELRKWLSQRSSLGDIPNDDIARLVSRGRPARVQ